MPKTTTSCQSRERNMRNRRDRRRHRRDRRVNNRLTAMRKGQHLHNHNNWFELYMNLNSVEKVMQKKLKKWHAKKQQFPGTIVFMKVGDFFEVFNEDADIFHKEFGFLYMKGGIAWTGFPRKRLIHYVKQLEDKGYNEWVLENF